MDVIIVTGNFPAIYTAYILAQERELCSSYLADAGYFGMSSF